jgi:hypothetical protein
MSFINHNKEVIKLIQHPSSVEKDNMLNKVKPVLRGHLLGNSKMALQDR